MATTPCGPTGGSERRLEVGGAACYHRVALVKRGSVVVAVVLAFGCGQTGGGRAFGVPADTDSGKADDIDDDSDSLDSISASASATQSATSSASSTAEPTSETSPDSSSSSGPSGDPTTDSTTAAMSSSEADGTTSCDHLVATWGDCLNYGNSACENEDATCLLNNLAAPTLGTCALLDCVNDCDCPEAPGTGTAQSRCDSIVSGGQNACYLDCSGGATCPDGMQCWNGNICMFTDLVCEDPAPAGTWADCANGGLGACDSPSALCLGDDTAGVAVCAFQDCVTDCDCPAAPATGNALVACGPIVADSDDNACFLSCSAGQTCPDGMQCFMDFICMW